MYGRPLEDWGCSLLEFAKNHHSGTNVYTVAELADGDDTTNEGAIRAKLMIHAFIARV